MGPSEYHQPKYRPEIDGLRAVAILSVLLYHTNTVLKLGVPLSGGYVGVDIFFVISGYLISKLILLEYAQVKQVDLFQFYERRARRLLPMLFLTLILCQFLAWRFLLPVEMTTYSESALSAILFTSNFYFYLNAIDYGAEDAQSNPLLHTWSLGVEEQFYLLFPIIFLALLRRGNNQAALITLLLVAASFVCSLYVGSVDSDLNFYLPVTRFWELGAGTIVALYEKNHQVKVKSETAFIFSFFGLLLIFASIFLFDKNTPHPGPATLAPVAGTALTIAFIRNQDFFARGLSQKLLVRIGTMSYSLYLLHFPIFAFANLAELSDTRIKILIVSALFPAAYIASTFFENRYRSRQITTTRFLRILSVYFLLCFGFSALGAVTNGFPERFSDLELEKIRSLESREYRALRDPDQREAGRLGEDGLSTYCYNRAPMDACQQGRGSIVFLGDSYVGHLERALIDQYPSSRVGFISMTHEACPFVPSDYWFGKRQECPLVNQLRTQAIDRFTENKIFVIAANEELFEKAKAREPSNSTGLGISGSGKRDVPTQKVWEAYFDGVQAILDRGHKVILIRSLPTPGIDGRRWLILNRHLIEKGDFVNVYSNSRPSEIIARDNLRFPAYDGEELIVIDPSEALCDTQLDACLDVKVKVGPLYNGGRHLSYEGAKLVSQLVAQRVASEGWLR